MKLSDYGFFRAGVAVPTLEVANPEYNGKEIAKIIKQADQENVKVLVFPELCIPSYTAADLFHQDHLLKESEHALKELVEDTSATDVLTAVGMHLESDNQLFNVAVVFHAGKILGVVPKTFIPNYNEFYEKRWFASSLNRISDTIFLCGKEVPFHENLLFRDKATEAVIGVEICEDLWTPVPPSTHHALYGANILLNLSASNEVIGKSDYRRDIVRMQSSKTYSCYLYSSAGETESTTDTVYSGHSIIAETGKVLKEIRFPEKSAYIYQDIDIEMLKRERRRNHSYMARIEKREYRFIDVHFTDKKVNSLERKINPHPFVPSSNEQLRDVFHIQATGLAQRMRKTGIDKAVIGISGGLDSTLALLVIVEAFKKLQQPMENIYGITMPGFGTTDRTYQNAITLMNEFGITVHEIPIHDAVEQHFKDIGYDPANRDVTYENSQARERTQILMDFSNKVGGLVVGTGDLSELALGWATYNGDHMSMYAVNSGVPKTLVRFLVEWYANNHTNQKISDALIDVYHTPVSPELLPPDEQGNIQQKTEEAVGKYELNDFFLYYMVRYGYTPKKIVLLTEEAFEGKYSKEEIKHSLKNFYRRFFTQQFKRSCMPDGVKIGTVNLSPRSDWRMPSDASYHIWVKEIDQI